jgi:hypothetical protein
MTRHFNSKLVRLSGKITEIYSDSLLLCGAVPIQHMDNLGCVKVHFGDDSAFFDNTNGNNGAPTSIYRLPDFGVRGLLSTAISTGRCNTCVKSLCRCLEL